MLSILLAFLLTTKLTVSTYNCGTNVQCETGYICIDDTTDDCDPAKGGINCIGICIKDVFCGGFGNIQCETGYECVDDWRDSCNTYPDGADCGGVCVPTSSTTTTKAAVTEDPCNLMDCKAYCIDGMCVSEGDECDCNTATDPCRGLCQQCSDGTTVGCACDNGACFISSEGKCSYYKPGECPTTTTETPKTTETIKTTEATKTIETESTLSPCATIKCEAGYCDGGKCIPFDTTTTTEAVTEDPCNLMDCKDDCIDGQCVERTTTDSPCHCTYEYDPYCCKGKQYGSPSCALCDGYTADTDCTKGTCPTTTETLKTTKTTEDPCNLIDCKAYCVNGECVQEGDKCDCSTAMDACRGLCEQCSDGTTFGCGCDNGACFITSEGKCSHYKPGECPTTTTIETPSTTNVCEIAPATTTCGGILGTECDIGVCVDDPTDDCDPDNGGADCIGICRPFWFIWKANYVCDFCLCQDGNEEECDAFVDKFKNYPLLQYAFLKVCHDDIGDCDFDNVKLLDPSNIDSCGCDMFYCDSPNCRCPDKDDPYCCKGNDFANLCEARCLGNEPDDCNNNKCGDCEDCAYDANKPYCCEGKQYDNACYAKCDGFDVDSDCFELTSSDRCVVTNGAVSMFGGIVIGFGAIVSVYLWM